MMKTITSALGKWTSASLVASMALHASAGGSFYLWVTLGRHAAINDIELATTALVPRPANERSAERSDDEWVLAQKKRKKAIAAPKRQVALPEPEACAGKCPASNNGTGEYVPAGDAHRKPRWIGNFITANDYPLLAKQQGKDGRVVLSVIIEPDGRVRDAQLIEGSYAVLNDVALAKVRDAVFSPALDRDGNAVACRARVPIRFELK